MKTPKETSPALQTNKSSLLPISTVALTPLVIARNIAKLRAVFPTLKEEFYEILIDRLQAKKFYDSEFIYVTNLVIETCKYPTPTIADFISYDKDREMPRDEEINPDEDLTYQQKYDKFCGDPIPGYKFPEKEKPEVLSEEEKISNAKFFKDNPDFEPC